MVKEYKVEWKPGLWDVQLDMGSYSDAREEHLYFHANDENEVWNFLCRYVEDVFTCDDDDYVYLPYGTMKALRVYCEKDDEEVGHSYESCKDCKTYIVKKWLEHEVKFGRGDETMDLTRRSDECYSVTMRRLNVITFLE